MSAQGFERYNTAIWIAAGLVALWGILGLRDQPRVPYSGYDTDGNNTVVRILPDSPAEQAGLMVDDYIRSIDGVSVEDSKTLARRQRPEIGETRTLVVARGETVLGAEAGAASTMSIDLTYSGLSTRFMMLGIAATLIGFCFLAFGLLAYIRAKNMSAMLLAMVGLFLGLAFMGGPYFSSYALRTAATSAQIAIIILGVAFLLHLMMVYPKPKAMLANKNVTRALYAPAVLMALFIIFLVVFNPPATSGLNVFVNILFGVFFVGYFGGAVVAMLHSYVKATPQERAASGLNLVLAGVLVGLLPVTIASLINIFAPRLVLPGIDFYFLTLVLIPITLAMGIMRPAPAATAVA